MDTGDTRQTSGDTRQTSGNTQHGSTERAQALWRLLPMIFFGVVAYLALWIVFLLAVLQYITLVATHGRNAQIDDFSYRLRQYMLAVFDYLLIRTEDMPFPFGEFPEGLGGETAAQAPEKAPKEAAKEEAAAAAPAAAAPTRAKKQAPRKAGATGKPKSTAVKRTRSTAASKTSGTKARKSAPKKTGATSRTPKSTAKPAAKEDSKDESAS